MDFAKDGRDSVGLFENDMIKTSVFYVLDPSSLELERTNGRHMHINE